MHVVYLGFARDLLGSLAVLWCLQGSLAPWCDKEFRIQPQSWEEALELLWKGLRRWCKNNKTGGARPRFNVFKLGSMGRTDGTKFPAISTKVKAMQMKVARTRKLWMFACLGPKQ